MVLPAHQRSAVRVCTSALLPFRDCAALKYRDIGDSRVQSLRRQGSGYRDDGEESIEIAGVGYIIKTDNTDIEFKK